MVGKNNQYLYTPEDIESGGAKEFLGEALKTGRCDGPLCQASCHS